MAESRPWWWHARALGVAFHLVAITLISLPSPGSGLNRQAWKDPTVQAEFAAWRERVKVVGIDWTAAEFEQNVWDIASGVEGARKTLLVPFQPYYKYCGTWQSWRMFVAPYRFPARLEIEVQEQGAWRTVYLGRSAEADWMAPWFDHDRMRASVFRFGWKHYARYRKQFVAWVGEQAERDFPEATRVRVSFRRYKTLSPEDAAAGKEFDWERELVNTRKLR